MLRNRIVAPTCAGRAEFKAVVDLDNTCGDYNRPVRRFDEEIFALRQELVCCNLNMPRRGLRDGIAQLRRRDHPLRSFGWPIQSYRIPSNQVCFSKLSLLSRHVIRFRVKSHGFEV